MGEMDDGFVEENPRWRATSMRKASDKLTVEELVNMGQTFAEADARGVGVLVTESLLFDVVSAYLGDDVFAARFVECMEILRRKNADYSQNEQKHDRIAAFKRIARDTGINPRQAWAVFAQKHWGAIMRYVKDGFVESEPVGGRINDMINYLVLFGPIVDWEQMGGGQ